MDSYKFRPGPFLLCNILLFVTIVDGNGYISDIKPERRRDLYYVGVLKDRHNYSAETINAAYEYVRHNFMTIFNGDYYLELERDVLVEILSDDNVNVSSEEIVFKSVIRWINYNKYDDFEEDLYALLEIVRFPFLSLKYLISDVWPKVVYYERCRSLYLEALRWHIFPDSRSTNVIYNAYTNMTKLRSGCLNSRLMFVASGTDTGTLELYDPVENEWTEFEIGINKKDFNVAFMNGKLAIVGGKGDDEAGKITIHSYDLSNGRKRTWSSVKLDRVDFSTAVVGEGSSASLYLFGGYIYSLYRFIKNCERWDKDLHRWYNIASMNIARSRTAAAWLDGKIYVVGGMIEGHIVIDRVEVYDVKNNSWTEVSRTNRPRCQGALVASDKYLYYVGGMNGKEHLMNTVLRYDPKTDKWSSIANIASSGKVGAAWYNNKLTVAGGETADVEIYDEINDKWTKLAPISDWRWGYLVIIPWNVTIQLD